MSLRLVVSVILFVAIAFTAEAQEKNPPAPKGPTPSEEPPVTPKRLDYRTPSKGRRVHLKRRERLKSIEIGRDRKKVTRPLRPIRFVYQGIVPNDKDAWRFRRRWENKALNYVTWIGFIRRPGRQRVFVQTVRAPTYRVLRPTPTRVIIEIDDAKIPIRNDRRPLLVREISTRLSEVTGKNLRGNKVHVIIDEKRPVQHTIEQRGVHFNVPARRRKPAVTIARHYLFIDFPY